MNSKLKIIFLTGHRKSGTSLTLNLFRGHPDICVFPTDPSIFYAYFGIFDKKKDSIKNKKKMLEKIIRHSLNSYFHEIHSKKKAKKKVDEFIDLFIPNVTVESINSYSSILKILAKSWMKFSNQEKAKYFLLKETSQIMNYNEFIKKPLNSRQIVFINIIRNPLDNYAALHDGIKSYYGKNGEDFLTLTAGFIFKLQSDIKSLDLVPKKSLKIIKYENLIQNPKSVMTDICNYLKIDFKKVLLQPKTDINIDYYGNSYDKVRSIGLSKRNINNWKNRIDIETAATVEFSLQEVIRKFNYKLQFDSNSYSRLSFDLLKKINEKFFYKPPIHFVKDF